MTTENKNPDEVVVERHETRKFKYSNGVSFDFEIDVSDPEVAVAEITDFIELLNTAKVEMEALRKTFAGQIEKKDTKESEANTTGNSAPKK